jgi:hypothetical protein
MPNLKIVPVTAPTPVEKVRQRVKSAPKPASMLQCRCGSREMIETKTGVLFKDGKPTGGTKQMICAACMLKGERVVVA